MSWLQVFLPISEASHASEIRILYIECSGLAKDAKDYPKTPADREDHPKDHPRQHLKTTYKWHQTLQTPRFGHLKAIKRPDVWDFQTPVRDLLCFTQGRATMPLFLPMGRREARRDVFVFG